MYNWRVVLRFYLAIWVSFFSFGFWHIVYSMEFTNRFSDANATAIILPSDGRFLMATNVDATPSVPTVIDILRRHFVFRFKFRFILNFLHYRIASMLFVWLTFSKWWQTQSNCKMNFIRFNQSKYMLKEVTIQKEIKKKHYLWCSLAKIALFLPETHNFLLSVFSSYSFFYDNLSLLVENGLYNWYTSNTQIQNNLKLFFLSAI